MFGHNLHLGAAFYGQVWQYPYQCFDLHKQSPPEAKMLQLKSPLWSSEFVKIPIPALDTGLQGNNIDRHITTDILFNIQYVIVMFI